MEHLFSQLLSLTYLPLLFVYVTVIFSVSYPALCTPCPSPPVILSPSSPPLPPLSPLCSGVTYFITVYTQTGAANPEYRATHVASQPPRGRSGERRAGLGPGHHGGAGGEEASTWDGRHSVRREKLGCESSGH